MGEPNVFVHTANAATIVRRTNFSHFSVTTNMESFQIDENLLSYRHVAIQTILIDGYDDAACGVLEGYLFIDVSSYVITCNTALNLNVIFNQLIAAAGNHLCILTLQFCNRDDIGLLDIIVAVRRRGEVRFVPVLIHTRS